MRWKELEQFLLILVNTAIQLLMNIVSGKFGRTLNYKMVIEITMKTFYVANAVKN